VGPTTINNFFWSVLPPAVPTMRTIRRGVPDDGPREPPAVFLIFDDRQGRRWARDFSGRLAIDKRDRPEDHRPRHNQAG
jgi:hypothetical protein